MSASRTGLYVEDCVEDIASLPAELQRLLSTMRELDERSQNLRNQIEEDLLQCLNLPSTFAEPEKAQAKLVNELRAELAKKQEQHLGLCTEKELLARQAEELVDSHEKRLSADLAKFEADLRQEGKLTLTASAPSGQAEKRKMPPPAFGAPPKRRDGLGGNHKTVKGDALGSNGARAREKSNDMDFSDLEGLLPYTNAYTNASQKRRSLGGSGVVHSDPPYAEGWSQARTTKYIWKASEWTQALEEQSTLNWFGARTGSCTKDGGNCTTMEEALGGA